MGGNKFMKYDDYMMENEYMDSCGNEENLEPCGECAYPGENPPMASRGRMIEVEEVLGTGTAETTTEICIPLCPPAFEVLDELVTKRIEFDAVVASKGKVFINGRVIKDIPYKTRVRRCVPGCNSISKLTYGNIRHVTAEVPFALCIDIPAAYKGSKAVVLNYDVESIEIPNHTNCLPGKCISRCEPAYKREDPCMRKLICSITEKDCISVTVKVVKDVIMTVPGTDAQF